MVRYLKNKAARKPCSVLDNHLSCIRITPNLQRFFPKMANNLSLRLNLASDRGLPSRYLPIPLVKLLTHRCTIACGIKPIGSSHFCGTIRRLTTPGVSPAVCSWMHGLSSPEIQARLSGCFINRLHHLNFYQM